MGKTLVAFFSASGTTAAGLKRSVAADTAVVEGKILNGSNSIESLQKWVETIL